MTGNLAEKVGRISIGLLAASQILGEIHPETWSVTVLADKSHRTCLQPFYDRESQSSGTLICRAARQTELFPVVGPIGLTCKPVSDANPGSLLSIRCVSTAV